MARKERRVPRDPKETQGLREWLGLRERPDRKAPRERKALRDLPDLPDQRVHRAQAKHPFFKAGDSRCKAIAYRRYSEMGGKT